MSERELCGLKLSGETTETTGTRSGKLFSAMSDERGLASRLAIAEETLATARVSLAERDQVVQELTSRLHETQVGCQDLQARVRQLQSQVEAAGVHSELDKLRALEQLRSEHACALRDLRSSGQDERSRMEEWIAYLKEGHACEKRLLQSRIVELELQVNAPIAYSSGHYKCGGGDHEEEGDSEEELSISTVKSGSSGTSTPRHTDGAVAEVAVSVEQEGDTSKVEPEVGVQGSDGDPSLMATVAQLLKAQTDVMSAQAQAASYQHLPPLEKFSGEGVQADDEGFDKWIEHFQERAELAGWDEKQKLYHLKLQLEKTAREAYRMFTDEERSTYDTSINALRKRFESVELRN